MAERPPSRVAHPFDELDRWLLRKVAELGPAPSFALTQNPAFREAGGRPGLTVGQAERWLRSAQRRGLLEPRADTPAATPTLRLTDKGRAAEGLGAGLPSPLHQVLDTLTHIRSPSWATLMSNLQDEDPNWIDRPLGPDPVRITRNPGAASDGEALENLKKIDHIVVLMLENRSFDHMLGYLSLRGQQEVNGLSMDLVNEGPDGRKYHPRRLGNTRIPKGQDPCHSIRCVREQIAGGEMSGFVKNFAATFPDEDPSVVMGFYSDFDVPVYDYLAHSYCLCDAWHAAVAGSTWVNRLYALTGQARKDQEGIKDLPHRLFWDLPAFTRQLEDANVDWRWYSHDPATLRLADKRYRDAGWLTEREHFRFFDRKAIGHIGKAGEELVVDEDDSFLDDVRHGKLPSVAWIDPNFIDLSLFERNSNDDHPPSDIHAGQELVLTLFRALVESDKSQFDKTMLVVTYDEHGGFFDHVKPPSAEDDNPDFRTHGVRVPAFVVSPLVEPGTVTHTLFDHTSLIKTILLRFAPDAVDSMGKRVSNANHLGGLLTREPAAAAAPPEYAPLVDRVRRGQARTTRSVRPSGRAAAQRIPRRHGRRRAGAARRGGEPPRRASVTARTESSSRLERSDGSAYSRPHAEGARRRPGRHRDRRSPAAQRLARVQAEPQDADDRLRRRLLHLRRPRRPEPPGGRGCARARGSPRRRHLR
jgi:phospholipase C